MNKLKTKRCKERNKKKPCRVPYKSVEERAKEKEKKIAAMKRPRNARENSIYSFMISSEVYEDFRNYVLLTGNTIIEYRRTLIAQSADGLIDFGDKVKLLHKKHLHRYIGEAAHQLWHPQFGKLVDLPPSTKKELT